MRIVTRPDFDGVVCAVLIGDALSIDTPPRWLEPNDFQKETVDIRAGDVVANLPYHPACDIWFDHHSTNRVDGAFKGLFRAAPSAARNVFDYFQGGHPRLRRTGLLGRPHRFGRLHPGGGAAPRALRPRPAVDVHFG